MDIHIFNNKTRLMLFFLLSLFAHFVAAYALTRFGRYDFAPPVSVGRNMNIDLMQALSATPPEGASETRPKPHQQPLLQTTTDDLTPGAPATIEEKKAKISSADSPATIDEMSLRSSAQESRQVYGNSEPSGIDTPPVAVPQQTKALVSLATIRKVGEFFSAKSEKFAYQISLFGVPVGNARLEATNNRGELRITSAIRSNQLFSAFYPVDNATDTRLFNGRYIITNIRRHEGDFRSDIGYTLLLAEKNIFRADRLKKEYANQRVPSEDVLDIITGLYFLRNQQLVVGKNLILNLFDTADYTPTTINILRKERISLPGLREVDTLVVQPLLENDGFFHTTGGSLIWLTDDEFRVPVKVETNIALGKIKVELISAETER